MATRPSITTRLVDTRLVEIVSGAVICPETGTAVEAWEYCRVCSRFVGLTSACADQGFVHCRASTKSKKRPAKQEV